MTGESSFASVRNLMAGISQNLYGQPCTLYPMASSGPNGLIAADATRDIIQPSAVRAEWSGRVELGDNGMGRASGSFRLGVNAPLSRATFMISTLTWLPRVNDELVWVDRPNERYRISESMPDGGTTLTVTLNKISQAN